LPDRSTSRISQPITATADRSGGGITLQTDVLRIVTTDLRGIHSHRGSPGSRTQGGSFPRSRHYRDVEKSSLGDAFSGNVALPKAKIQAAFQEGSTLLAKHVQEAREARHLADIFEWVAFVLAGVVTLLAGALGIVGDRAAENALAMLQQQTADGSARAKHRLAFRNLAVIVGLLSAGSGIATAAAHRLKEDETRELDTSRKVQDLLNQARRDVQKATESTDAESVLDGLRQSLVPLS
jgi:hypothetical protein